MNFALTVLLLVASLGLAFEASAQNIEAKIPFAFRVGDRAYDPGSYTLSPATPAHYRLAGSNGRGQFLRAYNPSDPAKEDKQVLVFQCYGSDCALMTVRLNGRGFTLPKSDWQPSAQIQAKRFISKEIVIAMK